MREITFIWKSQSMGQKTRLRFMFLSYVISEFISSDISIEGKIRSVERRSMKVEGSSGT